MATVTNLNTALNFGPNTTTFTTAGAQYHQNLAQTPHESTRYAQDGTLLGVVFNVSSSAPGNRLQVIAVADDTFTNVTTSNVKVSNSFNLAALGTSLTSTSTTLIYQPSESAARLTSFTLDPDDNIYVVFLRNEGTHGGAGVLKILKPSGGWGVWAKSTSKNIEVEILINELYTSFPNVSGTSANTATATGVMSTNYAHNVNNSGNNYIVTFYGINSPTSAGNKSNFIFYDVRNAANGIRTSGSYTSTATFSSVSNANVMNYCFAQASAFGAGGILSFDNPTTSTGNCIGDTRTWQVDQNGILYFVSTSFGLGPNFSENASKANAYQYIFIDDRRAITFTRSGSSGLEYRLGMIHVRWNGSNLNSGPGLSINPSTITSQSQTAVSGTGGTFASFTNTSNSITLQVFREQGFLRISNWTSGGYYDLPFTNTGVTTPFPATSHQWNTTSGVTSTGRNNGITQSPASNKEICIVGTGITGSIAIVKFDHEEDNVIPWVYPTDMPVANTMFTSPTTSSINATTGIKVTIESPTTWTVTNGLGISYYNKFMPNIIGYKLKRFTNATTDFLDASTATFSESEVNNNTTINPYVGDTFEIAANQWTNGTDYDISFAPNFTIGNQDTYGLPRTFSITTPGAAPENPTIRRIMRRSFPALSESHEYTFDNNAVVNKINISNHGLNTANVAIRIGDFYILAPVAVIAGATVTIDTSQRVDLGDRILLSSTSADVDLWITGTEGI